MKRLTLLVLPFLFLAACQDMPEPLAPSDDAILAQGTPGAIDLIVVLDGSFALGGGDANRERADEIARGLGLAPIHTYGTALFGFAASVPATQVEALRRNPMVAHVELDQPVSLPEPVFEPAPARAAGEGDAASSSSTQVVPWGIDRTGARDSGGTGRGVSVYVLDTGIDPDHPDLPNLGEGHTVFTSNCKGNPKNCVQPTWHDDHGHGTHVAGTIGAADNGAGVVGVAPGVVLHAVKVLSASGSGSRSGVIAGVDWVASHNTDRPRVANMSIGGAGGKVGTCTENGLIGSTDAYHAALCNARNSGVVFTVSAGNSGADAADQAPASFYDAAITVSATSCRFDDSAAVQTCETGTEAFTTWSNWGTQSDSAWPSEGSLPVAIAAPGANVLSTGMGGGHRYMSGTSMAAPHVAGGAALVLQQLGSQAADGSAFLTVRAALLGATECTATWHNVSGNPHSERFLNVRGSNPIDECVEPGEPPPSPPTNLRVEATTSTTVELAWDHESPPEATFEIWQYAGAWDHLTYVDGSTTYTVIGLSPDTHYRYAVRTVTEDEVSSWSNIVDVRTLPDEDSLADATATFTYDCGNDNFCIFEADLWVNYAHYTWVFEDSHTYSDMGAGRVGNTFSEAKSYTVQLTVQIGEDVASASEVITCAFRGRNLRCQ